MSLALAKNIGTKMIICEMPTLEKMPKEIMDSPRSVLKYKCHINSACFQKEQDLMQTKIQQDCRFQSCNGIYLTYVAPKSHSLPAWTFW